MRLHNGIPSPSRTRADDDRVLNQGSISHPTQSQNLDLIGELPTVNLLRLVVRWRRLVSAIARSSQKCTLGTLVRAEPPANAGPACRWYRDTADGTHAILY